MNDQAILYGVPRVAYGTQGCTPFPMCVRSCAEYMGIPVSYAQIMAESGAAFRLTWDTSCWNGGNVDSIFAFDDPKKTFICGLRAIGLDFHMLGRAPGTAKEDFIDFIRHEIDAGHPVIALGIIGPPEACLIAGYKNAGHTLLGWNVFQEYPEHRSQVRFEENGYFITASWWENPDTHALFATGTAPKAPLSPGEVFKNAAEVLSGRMCGSYAKGILAYDAWKNALLRESDFPENAILPLLVERMMCHGDAMDCLSDGRINAAKYLRSLCEKHPAQAATLSAAAQQFEGVSDILWKEMVPTLGGWGRGEAQIRRLAEPQTRRLLCAQIDRMKAHDERALEILDQLAEAHWA